ARAHPGVRPGDRGLRHAGVARRPDGFADGHAGGAAAARDLRLTPRRRGGGDDGDRRDGRGDPLLARDPSPDGAGARMTVSRFAGSTLIVLLYGFLLIPLVPLAAP